MTWKRIVLLIGILMMCSILVTPPTMSAQNTSVNTIYLLPQHGIIQEPSNNIIIQVRANLSADSPINVWQTNISFDHTCVNITDFTLSDPATGWSHSRGKYHEGGIEISALRFACGDAGSDILLANLTVHCEQWDCTSPLNFTGIVNAARFIGCTETLQKYHAAWINGTVIIEEQHGKERHAPKNGNSRDRGASQPSPSPTPTLTAAPTPTETPTLTPTFTPSASATPTQTPSSTIPPPTTIEQKRILMLVIGLMAVSIMGIIIYVALKLRKK